MFHSCSCLRRFAWVVGCGIALPLAAQTGGPPLIWGAPQQILTNSGIKISVPVSGSAPLSYQWLLNGVALAGATTNPYWLPTLQPSQSGAYSVVVSNVLGVATSASATLLIPNVISFNSDPWNQEAVPGDLTNVVQIAVDGGGGLALKADGTVVAWGTDDVPAGLTNAAAVALDSGAAVGLREDGTVISWGMLADPVGDASLSNIVAVSAGYGSRIALRADGTVAVWGGFASELTVPATATNVVQVASGDVLCLALKGDGTVVAWGDGRFGETNIPPGLDRVVSVATGNGQVLALRADGTVVAWGFGRGGECSVPANLGPAVGVAAGQGLSVALQADGTLVGWGESFGPTGPITGLFTNVVQAAASYYRWAGLFGSGPPFLSRPPVGRTVAAGSTVDFFMTAVGGMPLGYQWQFNGVDLPGATQAVLSLTNVQVTQAGAYSVRVSNALGQVTSGAANLTVLGLEIVSQPQPQQCFIGSSAVFSVVAGGTPPLTYQWQFNGANLVGCTNSSLVLTNIQAGAAGNYSVVVSHPGGSVTSAAALLYVSPYQVTVWGTNTLFTPQVPSDVDLVAVSAGFYYNLGLKSDGTVISWGANAAAAQPPADLTNAVAVAAASDFSLALRADGTVEIWGVNAPAFTSLVQSLKNVAALAVSPWNFSLVLFADGTVTGWGENGSGQTTIPAGLTNVVGVAVGAFHSLAAKGDGAVVAWGDDTYGQINVPANLSNVIAVAAGDYHSLALKADGTVVAWGRSSEGQTLVPPGLTNAAAIAGGGNESLVLKADNTVAAWGESGSHLANPPAGLSSVVAISATEGYYIAVQGGGQPFLTSQMVNRSVTQGATAHFRATASGRLPLSYQWRLNGANLPGATNAVFSLAGVQPSQAGAYSVVVTNGLGFAASLTAARLSVTEGSVPGFAPGSLLLSPDGQFHLTLQGAPPGARVLLLESINLVDWTVAASLTNTASQVIFSEPATKSGSRFYRAQIAPAGP